jgi:hypothetical protein
LADLATQFTEAAGSLVASAAELPGHRLQFLAEFRQALAHGAARIDCIVVGVIGEILRRHRTLHSCGKYRVLSSPQKDD